MTQSDKGLAKIAEGASPHRHAETSPVKVKDTHLMNNKLPPAEIMCGDCLASMPQTGEIDKIKWMKSVSMGNFHYKNQVNGVFCIPVSDFTVLFQPRI